MKHSHLAPHSSGVGRIAWTLIAIVIAGCFLAWVLLRSDASSSDKSALGVSASQTANAAELTGSVHNSSGQPIITANICAYGAQIETQLERRCAVTDAQGEYRISLPSGQYSVTASAVDHASRSSAVALQDEQTARLNFTLDAQVPTLAGIVSGASGERLRDARVTVMKGDEAIANVITNEQGEFFASTPSGAFAVKAEAAGFGAALVQTVAPTMDVRITLFPGNVVAGKVLLKDVLQPMPHVRVLATQSPDRMIARQRDAAVQTDAQGNFSFADLTAGDWTLSVDGPNVFGTLAQPVRVTIEQDVRDITLLVHPARKVTGRLLVGDDKPCPAGYIQFLPAALARQAASKPEGMRFDDASVDLIATPIVTAPIDASGAFVVTALSYGEYAFGPRCNEHQFLSGPKFVTVGEQPIDELLFKFQSGVGVTLRVVDEAQRPIAQVPVALSPASEEGLSRVQLILSKRSGVTDAQGQYRFGGLLSGNYLISARYVALIGNGKASAEATVTLQAGNAADPVTLTLPSAGSINIRAHSPAGTPVSRILFFALDSDGTRYEGRYAGDGKFNIGPLPRGGYRVFGYDNKNTKIALNGGAAVAVSGTVELDFAYSEPNGQLQGRVIDSNGTPMPGTFVRAVSTTLDEHDERYAGIQVSLHGAQEQMTDREGRFRITGLNAQGTYDLHVDHRDGMQDVRHGVMPGTFVEIAFPAESRIDGVVVDANGKQVTNFDVIAVNVRTGAQRSKHFASTNGAFSLDNIVPGDVQISIYDKSGDLSIERTGKLAAGQSFNMGRVVLSAGSDTSETAPTSEP